MWMYMYDRNARYWQACLFPRSKLFLTSRCSTIMWCWCCLVCFIIQVVEPDLLTSKQSIWDLGKYSMKKYLPCSERLLLLLFLDGILQLGIEVPPTPTPFFFSVSLSDLKYKMKPFQYSLNQHIFTPLGCRLFIDQVEDYSN